MKKIFNLVRYARNHRALIKCTILDCICLAAMFYGFYCFLWIGSAILG